MTPNSSRSEHAPSSKPLPQELRSALAGLVAARGESEARQVVHLSRSAFARALAGLTVYPGTVALIRAGLSDSAVQP